MAHTVAPTTSGSFSTSPSLLRRAELGDRGAWQQVVQLYGPLVYAWARKSGLRADDAADIVQESMIAVSNGLGRFDAGSGSSFRGWLRQIARNKCVDFIRKATKEPVVARGGSSNLMQLSEDALARELTSAGAQEQTQERQQVVGRAMSIMRKHFEKTTWQAFWRTVIDGCKPEEVAEELDLTRWNVYKARSRVLQRLRAELDGLEDLDN